MKFLHLADCHLDAPLVDLGQIHEKAKIRRHELKDTFARCIDLAKQSNVDVILISGDLFEHKYVEESTIKFIDNKFKEISNIKVFISPGNHDPYINNSYYNNYSWSENVFIFKGTFEKVFVESINTNIWGVGFNDFYVSKSLIKDIDNNEKDKINILLTHGSVDMDASEAKYHPLTTKTIVGMGFDYSALGHIHKNVMDEKNNICYPGSPEPLGFDELEPHGIIMGELTKDYKKIKFYPICQRQYFIQDVEVDGLSTHEEVIDKIKVSVNFKSSKENFYKINLVGKLDNFLIDTLIIEEGLKNFFYFVKVEDNTELPYNLEELEKEYNLKGLFVKRMNNLIKKANDVDKAKLQKALHYGLDVLIKGEVKL